MLVDADEHVRVSRLHAERRALQPGLLHLDQQIHVGQVGADAVDEDPRHVVEFLGNQHVGQLHQPRPADVGAIVEHADLQRAQVLHQMPPLLDDVLRRTRAPFDGHDALRAEGAAVRAAAAGHDGKAARAVDRVGGRLQVGVAIHLEQVVGRPGQAVQVGDHRAVGVAVQLTIAGLVAGALDVAEQVELWDHQSGRDRHFRSAGHVSVSLIAQEAIHDVTDFDPGDFPFATHNQVHRRLAQRFKIQIFGHHADVRAAQHDRDVQLFLDSGRGAPGRIHLRRVGRDADQMGAELVQEVGQWLLFDVRVVNAHLIPAPLRYRAQIRQPQVRGGAGINRQAEFGVN